MCLRRMYSMCSCNNWCTQLDNSNISLWSGQHRCHMHTAHKMCLLSTLPYKISMLFEICRSDKGTDINCMLMLLAHHSRWRWESRLSNWWGRCCWSGNIHRSIMYMRWWCQHRIGKVTHSYSKQLFHFQWWRLGWKGIESNTNRHSRYRGQCMRDMM